jgi:hypothetical protein
MVVSHTMMSVVTKKSRALIPLFAIIGAFLVTGAVLIGSGILPEEGVREFRSLTDISISTNMEVIKNQHSEIIHSFMPLMMWRNEVLILPKAMQRVKQLLDESKAKEAAVTIAAVQPTLMADRENGELLLSTAGQVIITANWQMMDGAFYSEPKNPADCEQKMESHQQIWNILVDVNERQF